MKIHGNVISGPNIEIIVIPRGNGVSDVVLKAQAVLNRDDFNRLCPAPKPQIRKLPGNRIQENISDPAYKEAVIQHNKQQFAWLVIESLKATDGLTWDTVFDNDPSSWLNYEKELNDSGFSPIEINRITAGVMTANCLNEERVEEARKNFLQSLEEVVAVDSLTQEGEQNSTPSTEPASV